MSSQVLNHTNIRAYPGPIPIDSYARRSFAARLVPGRDVIAATYAFRTVVDKDGTGKVRVTRALVETSRQTSSTATLDRNADKKKHGSERVRYIRLMIIIEAANALALYGTWHLWHMIH